MKTPHAILIALSLIAAAIFFTNTAANFNFVKDAHAYSQLDQQKHRYSECYFKRMGDAHTETSSQLLKNYCSWRFPIK